ncbi:hypothetical protein H633G_00983 [Metarhizium anisopliae BRIP 53284]|nr:hypothetical protein H633G_00983 [Metarhizium anisopliae BRIP 53284]
MTTEVSNTRLYLGNLPRNATKADIEAHFATHGTGDITEVKLMNGFGFIEYKDPMDARDVTDLTSWESVSLFSLPVDRDRGKVVSAAMSALHRDPDELLTGCKSPGFQTKPVGSFVEYETAADLRTAVDKLDGREFKGNRVQCIADTQPDMPPRDGRGRSRSPGGRRPYNNVPPRFDEYDRRGPPPRGYNRDPGPYGYRDRSPRREYYEDRARYRSPPRGPAPVEDYPPARGRYEDPYRRDYPPPPPDPYANGRQYDRPPRDFAPREPAYPPRDGYAREYDRGGRYW